MAKQRYINTKFWSDSWIREKLNALDRYLFLYLLTNEHTNISGIYELPLSLLAFESGIDKEELEKTMFPHLAPKVYYEKNWVIIVNFPNHQDTKNPKIMTGIQVELEKVPLEIYEKALEHGYPIGRISHSNSNSNSNLIKLNTTNVVAANAAPSEEVEINKLLKLFEPLNPMWKTNYANKTQRGALKRILKSVGKEKLELVLNTIPKTNEMKYAPIITTPLELEKSFGKLIAFIQKEKLNSNKIIKV